jgi:hypothetical protein
MKKSEIRNPVAMFFYRPENTHTQIGSPSDFMVAHLPLRSGKYLQTWLVMGEVVRWVMVRSVSSSRITA